MNERSGRAVSVSNFSPALSSAFPSRAVGITTTVPMEILYAAGRVPVDLNNRFITSPQAPILVEQAEYAGFPRSMCSWVKGIYSTVHMLNIRTVVGVVQGDCSNTRALMEVLRSEGIQTIEFSFPYDRDPNALRTELERLASRLGTNLRAAEDMKVRLDRIRRKIDKLDELTWTTHQVGGEENHLWQIQCSDFGGDPDTFERELDIFLDNALTRPARQLSPRLAFIGIPPICSDLYKVVQASGAGIVFNEMQRQFAMPYRTASLVEQYRRYTYPYDIFFRLEDIIQECEKRRVDGAVHYVQSFCFRQIHDRMVRESLKRPILTLECDRPGPLEARNRTRLEAFLEMLRERNVCGRVCK
mgnify:CR=1 FL=1